MSRLTDYQIRAMITSLEFSAASNEIRGRMRAAHQSREKAARYKAELDARAAGTAKQEPQRNWINGRAIDGETEEADR